MFMGPTDQTEISNIINKMKPKTSKNKDDLSTKIVKEVAQNILVPLTHIMNLSLANGIVPDEMKIAKVIPLHKAGEKSEFNYYRPISLLQIFSKILERLVYTRIITFIETNKYFYQHRYGFRKGHSTIHPIMQFLNEIYIQPRKIDLPKYRWAYLSTNRKLLTLSVMRYSSINLKTWELEDWGKS